MNPLVRRQVASCFRNRSAVCTSVNLRSFPGLWPPVRMLRTTSPHVENAVGGADTRELVPLSHAVVFAAAQLNRAPEATMLRDLMAEAYQLRRKLLTSAVALAEAGLIPVGKMLASFVSDEAKDAMILMVFDPKDMGKPVLRKIHVPR